MKRRIFLVFLAAMAFIISACDTKNTIVQVTPTVETTEEVIEADLGE